MDEKDLTEPKYLRTTVRYVNLPNFSGDSFQLSWQILGSGLITLSPFKFGVFFSKCTSKSAQPLVHNPSSFAKSIHPMDHHLIRPKSLEAQVSGFPREGFCIRPDS